MNMSRIVAAAALVATAAAGEATAAAMGETREFWGAITYGDQKIGHLHQRFSDPAGPGEPYVSEWETRLVLGRGGTPLEMRESASVREDADGVLLAFTYELLSFSGGEEKTAMRTSGVVRDGVLHVTSNGYVQEVVPPSAGSGPQAQHRRLMRERESGTPHEYEELTFMPELVRCIKTRVAFGDWETVQLRNGEAKLQRVTRTMEIRPLHPDVQWVDAAGVVMLAEIDVPMLGKAKIHSCDRETALMPSIPVEFMASTVVPSPARIPAPRYLQQARYWVRYADDGKHGLCEGQGQEVERLADGSVLVTVDGVAAARVDADAGTDKRAEAAPSAYLRPSTYIESDAPLIREMAAEAVGEVEDPVEAARRIESYVRSKIVSKTLDMGFATALETARALRGDCSEHGVLVAALARARGIPSRLVVGIAYVGDGAFGVQHENGVFVFHVWAELLVAEDVWFPVDAALGSFDATHIALTKSPMDTPSPVTDLCLPVLEIVDSLRIERAEFAGQEE